MSQKCPHCIGGTVPSGHNHLAYKCQDCEGTGQISYCIDCSEQIPGESEQCAECEELEDGNN